MKQPSIPNSKGLSRVALTLLELVIVLVILAALTGVAVQAIDPIADQARYEATQRTLINVDEAIVRQTLTSDRVVNYSGFVADIGRLPIAVGDDSLTQLAELWNQGTLSGFSVNAAFDDPALDGEKPIPVAAGWRGPYLSLPPGRSVLRDGFGRPFGVINKLDAAAVSGEDVVNLVSAGANNIVDPSDGNYDRDLRLPGGAWTQGRYMGSVNVTLKDSSGSDDPVLNEGETLRVRLYGPVNGAAALLSVVDGTPAATTPTTMSFSEMILDQVVGPRAVVGYVTIGTSEPYQVIRQSAVKQIVLAPGMNPSVQLRLNPSVPSTP